jgi:hypothetical protein
MTEKEETEQLLLELREVLDRHNVLGYSIAWLRARPDGSGMQAQARYETTEGQETLLFPLIDLTMHHLILAVRRSIQKGNGSPRQIKGMLIGAIEDAYDSLTTQRVEGSPEVMSLEDAAIAYALRLGSSGGAVSE